MSKTSNETKQLMKDFMRWATAAGVTATQAGASSIAVKMSGTNDAILVRFSGPRYSFRRCADDELVRRTQLIERTKRWRAAALKSQKEATEKAEKYAQQLEEYSNLLD